jgi:hypothetical protein
MSYERIVTVKRTIYVSECECGDRTEVTENPPKERFCKCGKWVPFKEVSYTGPELTKGGR